MKPFLKSKGAVRHLLRHSFGTTNTSDATSERTCSFDELKKLFDEVDNRAFRELHLLSFDGMDRYTIALHQHG